MFPFFSNRSIQSAVYMYICTYNICTYTYIICTYICNECHFLQFNKFFRMHYATYGRQNECQSLDGKRCKDCVPRIFAAHSIDYLHHSAPEVSSTDLLGFISRGLTSHIIY